MAVCHSCQLSDWAPDSFVLFLVYDNTMWHGQLPAGKARWSKQDSLALTVLRGMVVVVMMMVATFHRTLFHIPAPSTTHHILLAPSSLSTWRQPAGTVSDWSTVFHARQHVTECDALKVWISWPWQAVFIGMVTC